MPAGFSLLNTQFQGVSAPLPRAVAECDGDFGGAASAAKAAEAALPCLLSDNSDGDRVKLCGVDRKRAETTRQNIANFQRVYGVSMGLLTVTFSEDLSTRAAQRKLANFKRRVLRTHFGDSITVREFTQRGRPHFHLAIDCRGDISTGYNWDHHEDVTAWSKGGRKAAKPHGSLNRSPRLKELHRVLNEKAPLYGLGRIELVPIKKPEAIAFYLGGYLAKSMDHKPADAKRTRAVNYSHRCPRIMSGKWSWNNESGWLWRAKLRAWAQKHGCSTMDQVRSLFGLKWAYHHRDAILATELDYYPTSVHARRDGVNVPSDSVDIRVTRGRLNSVEAQSEAISAARAECQPQGSETSKGVGEKHPIQPPSGNPRRGAAARAGARNYVLQTSQALSERLGHPQRFYQRPLRLAGADIGRSFREE